MKQKKKKKMIKVIFLIGPPLGNNIGCVTD